MPRAVILVEGESDAAAMLALADRQQIRLAAQGIAVVDMGGVTNIGTHLARYPADSDVIVAGVCDAAEAPLVRRALFRADRLHYDDADLSEAGFFVCDPDLEAELIAAAGVKTVEGVAVREGELRSFRVMQMQPRWADQPTAAQLRRWIAASSGRKKRYAEHLIRALDTDAPPPAPLAAALDWVAGHLR